MITGKAKIDFRVGPDLYLRGVRVSVPDKFSGMVVVEPVKQKIVSKETIDDVIRDKINTPKKVFAQKKKSRAKK